MEIYKCIYNIFFLRLTGHEDLLPLSTSLANVPDHTHFLFSLFPCFLNPWLLNRAIDDQVYSWYLSSRFIYQNTTNLIIYNLRIKNLRVFFFFEKMHAHDVF